MGGRGAASGRSDKGKLYGTEFKSLMTVSNIKFVHPTDSKSTKAPLETMTKGRIYATVNENGQINSINYYDPNGKHRKTIDLLHGHNGIAGEHTHVGYYHSEGGTRRLTTQEKDLVAFVKKVWYNKKDK